MVALLIMAGAEVNDYSLTLKKIHKKDACLCTTILAQAIKNSEVGCVKALVTNGAFYNNKTIEFAEEIYDNAEEDRKENSDKYLKYDNARQVYEYLKSHHKTSFESLADEFMRKNLMTGKKLNYFEGMEEF